MPDVGNVRERKETEIHFSFWNNFLTENAKIPLKVTNLSAAEKQIQSFIRLKQVKKDLNGRHPYGSKKL